MHLRTTASYIRLRGPAALGRTPGYGFLAVGVLTTKSTAPASRSSLADDLVSYIARA